MPTSPADISDRAEVLIVADHPTQAERQRRLLETLHCHVRLCHDGQRALAAMRERPPQLVLADVLLGELDGFGLCRAIRTDAALHHIPVILITALNDPQDMLRSIECGASRLIRKPCADHYLRQCVELLLGDARAAALPARRGERQQMLTLLMSTYEQAVLLNRELQGRERQVQDLSQQLARLAGELAASQLAMADKFTEQAEASRVKSTFIATMSHELRTPLNAIIGFTGALLMKLPGPLTAEQERQLLTVQGSARHLLSLINDLLDVAKIEAGKVTLSMQAVQCEQLVREVADTLRPLAQQKGLELETCLPEQAQAIATDRRALTQILINLANNAIKFTERGKVCLSLSQRREHSDLLTEFTVTDSGRGIGIQDQSKLFQAFSQLDSSPTRHSEGAGLGLYLSQQLAKLLDGNLSLRSSLGHGSAFTLLLRNSEKIIFSLI